MVDDLVARRECLEREVETERVESRESRGGKVGYSCKVETPLEQRDKGRKDLPGIIYTQLPKSGVFWLCGC